MKVVCDYCNKIINDWVYTSIDKCFCNNECLENFIKLNATTVVNNHVCDYCNKELGNTYTEFNHAEEHFIYSFCNNECMKSYMLDLGGEGNE